MGRRKSQKVGNRYKYGLHLIPARKADAILAVRMADKVLWEGDQGNGYISIDAPDAFGGDEREGGFSGRIAVMLGGASQTANAYMQALFGALTPAYRGVVSLIFERPYFNANSARLPAVSVKQVNVADIHKGWLPEKCVVEVVGKISASAIYIAFDNSNSMTPTRLATQGAALAGFVRSMKGQTNSVKVVAHSGTINGRIERLDCTDADYEAIALWIEGYTTTVFGGNWNNAVSEAAAFFAADDVVPRRITLGSSILDIPSVPGIGGLFGGETKQRKRRVVIFTTDGVPDAGTPELAAATLAAIGGVEVFAFNIELTSISETVKIDNTPGDGVPVVSGSDPNELRVAVSSAFRSWVDLNPAHIQRCLLIDKMRGGTALPEEIGDSFAVAADEYLVERFGLSVIFSGVEGNQKDRIEIDRHCDAVTFRSRKTGKWEHKRIRDDFDLSELPVLDGTVVKDWSKLRRPKRREMPNKLTVIYTDRSNGKTASVTKSNPVAVRAARVARKGDDARYPFVSNQVLADRLCARDVAAGAAALLSGDIPLAYLPADFEQSTALLLRAPEEGINDVPVRVTEIRHGAGTDSAVWLKVVEHRFQPGARFDPIPAVPITPVDDRPVPATLRLVAEAPYLVLVLSEGQSSVDGALADDPDQGRLMAAAEAPNARHLDATVGVDAAGGYSEEGLLTFSPSTVTLEPMLAEADQFEVRVALNVSMGRVVANQLAQIGSEILRVDSLVIDGVDLILTVGRGCLDTVPQAHASGADILFFGPGDVTEDTYTATEAVDVRLLTRTAKSLLSLAAAPTDTVTFASRAIRPYPPGRFKLNGSYAQDQFTGDVVLTWVHRDRTLQTTPVPEDHDDATIGPEAGTTYRVRAEALDAAGDVISTVTDVNVGALLTYDWNDATALPSGTLRVRFSVASVRGGYESWQRPSITSLVFSPPGGLTVTVI
jgi:hypothetical protein